MTKSVVRSVHVTPTFGEQRASVRNAGRRVDGVPVEENSLGTESNKMKRWGEQI